MLSNLIYHFTTLFTNNIMSIYVGTVALMAVMVVGGGVGQTIFMLCRIDITEMVEFIRVTHGLVGVLYPSCTAATARAFHFIQPNSFI